MTPSQRAWQDKRLRGWRKMIFLREWENTGSLWPEDWEAGERAALREEFGVLARLERAPRVADDADVVWQNSADAYGHYSPHVAMWHPELKAAYRGKIGR